MAKWLRVTVATCLAALALAGAVELACRSLVDSTEHSRYTSPSGDLEAVIVLRNPGAFSSYIESLVIRKVGTSGGAVVLEGKRVIDSIRWRSHDTVEVTGQASAIVWNRKSECSVDGRRIRVLYSSAPWVN